MRRTALPPEVQEAQRIVSRQGNCSMGDALARMISTAEVTDETLEQIAQLVIRGGVRFDLSI